MRAACTKNKDSFAALLRQCTASRSLPDGRQLHAQLVALGQDGNTLLGNLLVQMYASCGRMDEAVAAFQCILRPNVHSWTMVMTGYAQTGHVQEARRMFGLMPQRDVVVWTTTMAALAQADHLGDAKLVFDDMPQRNDISWNALLTAFARHGYCGDARLVLARMPSWGDVSFNALLHGSVQQGELEEAAALFTLMPEHNVIAWNIMLHASPDLEAARSMFDGIHGRDQTSWNSLVVAYSQQQAMLEDTVGAYQLMPCHSVVASTAMVHAYGACGMLPQSRRVFDEMGEHDLVSWNVLLATHAQNNKQSGMAPAKHVFDSMPCWNICSWNTLLQAYAAEAGCLDEAGALFAGMKQTDVISCTGMIVAYGRAGLPWRAWTVFQEEVPRPGADAKAWAATIDALAQNEQVEAARLVLDRMPRWSAAACTSMVIGLGQAERVEEAEAVFHGMQEHDYMSWTAMVTAYAHNGRAREALSLFRRMDLGGHRPDRVTYVSVVQACSNLAALHEGRLVHGLATADGYEHNAGVGSALINLYGRCGLVKEARALLAAVTAAAGGDARPWTAMMIASSQNGQPSEAIQLFRELTLDGIAAERISLASVLAACSHGGLVDDGWYYFGATVSGDYGVEATLDHYLCMLALLGRAGLLAQAEQLVECMPFQPDAVAWVVVLAACKSMGDSSRGERIARRLFELDPESAPGHVLLASTHAAAGSATVDWFVSRRLYNQLRSGR